MEEGAFCEGCVWGEGGAFVRVVLWFGGGGFGGGFGGAGVLWGGCCAGGCGC